MVKWNGKRKFIFYKKLFGMMKHLHPKDYPFRLSDKVLGFPGNKIQRIRFQNRVILKVVQYSKKLNQILGPRGCRQHPQFKIKKVNSLVQHITSEHFPLRQILTFLPHVIKNEPGFLNSFTHASRFKQYSYDNLFIFGGKYIQSLS